MKLKFTLFLAFIALFTTNNLWAQSDGDYRSILSGDWNIASNWEEFNAGTWSVAGTAPTSTDGIITIQNTHVITVTSATSADDLVIDAGGTLTVATAGVFTLVNGAAGSDMTINGTFNVSAASTYLGSITNNGTFNWGGGTLTFTSVTLDNNGTFNATTDNLMDATGTTFNNTATGTLNKNAGAGQTNIEAAINNAGAININSGTLRIPSPGTLTNSGSINFTNNTNLISSFTAATLNAGTTFSGNGTYQVFGTTTINTPVTFPAGVTFSVNSQIPAAPGSITIGGSMLWTANAIRVPITISSGGTLDITTASAKTLNANLTNDGTINWVDGQIFFNAATFTNNNIFNINLAASNAFTFFAGTTQFNNTASGHVNKSNAATTFTITGIPVVNAGIIEGVGIINNTAALTNNGYIYPGVNGGVGELTMNPAAVSPTSTEWFWIMDGSGAGTGHDRLTLTNNTDLTGSSLYVVANTSVPLGTYEIMRTSAGTFTGNFGTVNIPLNYTLTVNPTSITVTKTAATLPVVWGSFTVKENNRKAEIKWSTLEEINTSHFVVEYSSNGIDYRSIATVQAQGNADHTSNYSYTHQSPNLNGKNFYRIKQYDLDGRHENSPYRMISFSSGNIVKYSILPNPIVSDVTINITEENVRINVLDASGRMVRIMVLQPGMHNVNLSNLVKGVYYFAIYENEKMVETKTIIKQ
ncbi:MAG: T9SS type A sorting domain-containing protein [Flavisolibacter sp.]